MKRAVSLRVVWEGGVLNSPVKKASSDAVGFLDDRAAQLHTGQDGRLGLARPVFSSLGRACKNLVCSPEGSEVACHPNMARRLVYSRSA